MQGHIQRGGVRVLHPPVLGNCRQKCVRRQIDGVRQQNDTVGQILGVRRQILMYVFFAVRL